MNVVPADFPSQRIHRERLTHSTIMSPKLDMIVAHGTRAS
jgi:hypothetical protein